MAPRKTPKPLADVLAATIRRQREENRWSQEDLAKKMVAMGFKKWTRSTVAEVEGAGRGRQVAVSELLALSEIFNVSVAWLLWDDAPVRVESKFVINDVDALHGLLVSPTVMALAGVDVVAPFLRKELERLYGNYMTRVQSVSTELRDLAGYLEDNLADQLKQIGGVK